jgi:hypothetical protein
MFIHTFQWVPSSLSRYKSRSICCSFMVKATFFLCLETANLFSIFKVFSFQKCYVNVIIWLLLDWLFLLLTINHLRFIQLCHVINNLFLLLLKSITKYECTSLFTYSSVWRYLDYFYFFDITNKNNINIQVQVFVWTHIHISLG